MFRMTLIVTTIQRQECILTADGSQWRGRRLENDRLQKVFPVPGASFAIAHHGINILGGRPVFELIEEFFEADKKRLPDLSPSYAAQALGAFMYPHTPALIAAVEQVCQTCFLVVGFGKCCENPHCFEVTWRKTNGMHVEYIWHDHGNLPSLILSGDAAKRVLHHTRDEPDRRATEQLLQRDDRSSAMQFHDSLYSEAAENASADCPAAGHRHRLLVRRDGCEWMEAPVA
jgi:hypothetical protein